MQGGTTDILDEGYFRIVFNKVCQKFVSMCMPIKAIVRLLLGQRHTQDENSTGASVNFR